MKPAVFNEVLMEKIVLFDVNNEIPQKFYELVNSFKISEQESLYEIFQRIVEYKNL